ncbi:carbon-phosphorus lyase complex subunit PhnI [Pseudonocardia sp. HH130630-07]|uniref:carbon-phosphorus lyase complex subunit PhnI n=1 Tax=Pseudonocardia sp. HH130630-07 TaxID=1690815 RepID=UPI0008152B73|nr:carbon-phosphorus lyase complex subunit PhnI [Pseudonocardia sp. HH130630-07]ANY10552.1 carbon-phosphorus lyase complex subunit PhnI [Pseudonocardia sp. HH130630-07]
MYVAVKGGERAIANAHALLAKVARKAEDGTALDQHAVRRQLPVLLARVMSEGSLHDPDIAAHAIVQAQGDVVEAITLVRTYRTTLPRFGNSLPIDTAELPPQRRISATFKDLPGGQQLGATFDYTHRLLATASEYIATPAETDEAPMPRITELLAAEALLEPDPRSGTGETDPEPGDLTRDPTTFPMTRAERLQGLARSDEGFLLALGYSTQRGFGRNHPFAGEIRTGEVEIEFDAPELGFAVPVGRIEVTECQMINQFTGSAEAPAQFTRGYGLTFGRGERKAMAMSLVDRALRAEELGERSTAPAQDEEFVLSHGDNVEAAGFVEHLKLPHYVDFQAELGLIRQLRREHTTAHRTGEEPSQ